MVVLLVVSTHLKNISQIGNLRGEYGGECDDECDQYWRLLIEVDPFFESQSCITVFALLSKRPSQLICGMFLLPLQVLEIHININDVK